MTILAKKKIIFSDEAPFDYLVKKVKDTGILINRPKREKPKTVRTPENIAASAESVCEAPLTSIHHVVLNN